MPRPMSLYRPTPAGTCPACRTRFAPDAQVIATRSGGVVCAGHEGMFAADAVTGRGRYADIRRAVA